MPTASSIALPPIRSTAAPAIVVDFGSSICVDVVSAKGEFLGGAIAPGIQVSSDAAAARSAALRRVELTRPRSVVGQEHRGVHAGRRGVRFRGSGRRSGEPGPPRRRRLRRRRRRRWWRPGTPRRCCCPTCTPSPSYDPHLTLEGLRLVFERNQNDTRGKLNRPLVRRRGSRFRVISPVDVWRRAGESCVAYRASSLRITQHIGGSLGCPQGRRHRRGNRRHLAGRRTHRARLDRRHRARPRPAVRHRRVDVARTRPGVPDQPVQDHDRVREVHGREVRRPRPSRRLGVQPGRRSRGRVHPGALGRPAPQGRLGPSPGASQANC